MSVPKLRVISLGAGVQSTTMALMAACGEIAPMPDYAIFADTDDEKRGTYRHLDWLETKLPFPIRRVRRGNISLSESTIALYRDGGGYDQTPPFFYPGGMLAKHCSKEWKTRVIVREIRRILGLAPGQRGRETVEVWIGISREEAHRVKPSEVPWIANRWPLVDMALRRGHCVQWLQSHGYPVPPRSACVYCPYQSDDEFAGMKSNHVDDDWSRAVAFDDAIRPGGISTTGPLYVSRHRKALAEIEFEDVPDLFGNECEGMCGV